ncbi:hypothetical protein [Algoriphagus sp.]|uniref:hypothetical protein n=1 Tax=Algoriphagus sp. TaxID=1872435 RepID=UPI003F7111AE
MQLNSYLKVFIFILAVLLSTSCKKDKEEEPLIIPFLEVIGIEEVEPARFAISAQIKENGSLPILEYGFLFSDESSLFYSSDRIHQAEGDPGERFESSFEKILVKDKNYYIQAFVRTQNDITYSPIYRFVGGDPPGFQYLGSSFPAQVYYGDTVTVRGKYLPASLDSINVKFNMMNAELFNLTDSSFSYTIPIDIFFGGQYRTEGFVLKLRMNGNHSEIHQKFKFRPAVFPEYTEVSMAEIWELPGNYLFSSNYQVNGLEDTELYGSYTIHNVEDDKISFSPKFVPNTNEPTLGINIRDSTYTIRHVKIRTAEFAPDQKRTITTYNQTVTANARDFNAFVKNGNYLIIDTPDQVVANVTKADAESISFAFHLSAPISGRTFNLYGYNQGVKGKVPLEITYNLPAYPVSYLDTDSEETLLFSAMSFTHNKKMHVLSDLGSFIYDVPGKRTTYKGNLPHIFSEVSVFRAFLNGKYYFSNNSSHGGLVNAVSLFQYDPNSGISTSAGYLPMSGRVLGSFVSGDHMYYEVSYLHGDGYIEELWAWNGIYNSEWKLIRRNTLSEPGLYDVGKIFEWQGQNLRFIQYYDAPKDKVMDKLDRYNSETNTWETMHTFPGKFDVSFRAFSTESGVYLSNGNEFYLFSPASLTVKYLGKTDNYDIFTESLSYEEGKFYYINKNGNALINELDPAFLTP